MHVNATRPHALNAYSYHGHPFISYTYYIFIHSFIYIIYPLIYLIYYGSVMQSIAANSNGALKLTKLFK